MSQPASQSDHFLESLRKKLSSLLATNPEVIEEVNSELIEESKWLSFRFTPKQGVSIKVAKRELISRFWRLIGTVFVTQMVWEWGLIGY